MKSLLLAEALASSLRAGFCRVTQTEEIAWHASVCLQARRHGAEPHVARAQPT